LPELPGLDIEAGLSYLLGKRGHYRQLLERLVREHFHAPVVLHENVLSGNYVEARRIAHSLKGASALLGAETIRSTASRIEEQLRDKGFSELPSDHLEPDLSALTQALSDLSHGLASTGLT
jgi:HPt (histidine-containing phosphotransfer) domain-containing protein